MIVASIMSKKVHTISPEKNLAELKNTFAKVKYRHLLVEENGRLIGIISNRDLLAHISPFLDTTFEQEHDRSQMDIKVGDIMSRNPVTVDPETLIDCASILLLENPISALPVVTPGMRIVGILSWKDILQYHVYGVDQTLRE